MPPTMKANMQHKNRNVKGSPKRISRASQTPKTRESRSKQNERLFSKESSTETPSIPPPANSPMPSNTVDSHDRGIMYNLFNSIHLSYISK